MLQITQITLTARIHFLLPLFEKFKTNEDSAKKNQATVNINIFFPSVCN